MSYCNLGACANDNLLQFNDTQISTTLAPKIAAATPACLLTDPNDPDSCYDFNQGNVRFFAEPRGSERLPARNEIDLRAEWFHVFHGANRLGLMVDVFNALNQYRPTDVSTIGSTIGEPQTVNFPRTIRLGMRYGF